ncbi:phosphoenolpyruvate-protein phosphotransferase [Actinoplanes sp. SE50]|uniref:putative PEP-binding protein n=1 Tax=unclassified Actinoplanes TaxID=2626549 RepID=UPI00023EC159|nr:MULTISPECIES: putative PEP-binding protein [unclassified Actinoplanes]AEV86356.1 Phosphoenolpyruvate-protein phosphotransferase [Actinoplanes sp. SE50/110]ATO84753.1 phosphoenolpyruvate-protein phosphotransferase [Actinoplanes sp. SE50]SLM02163.1 Phosphoenolpyruvate-protein phosphotransferase [Actinoplanes sp. SE50/110]
MDDPGIAYGYGRHRGLLVDRSGVEEIVFGRVLLYLEKADTDLINALAARLSGVIIEEPVTPYAPEARALWALPVPVLTGVRVDDSWLGHEVVVDFDAATTAPPAPATAGLRLHAEVSSPAEARDAGHLADGWAPLRADDLRALSAADRDQLWAHLADSGRPLPAVRYFDEPAGSPPAASFGRRGVRSPLPEDLDFLGTVIAASPLDDPLVVLPMVAVRAEISAFAALADPAWRLGLDVATPAAALAVADLVDDCHLLRISSGDLAQHTLVWDRSTRNDTLLPPDRLPTVITQLVEWSASVAATRSIPCQVSIDLRPTPQLHDQLRAAGVTEISCPPPLIRHWRHLLDRSV